MRQCAVENLYVSYSRAAVLSEYAAWRDDTMAPFLASLMNVQ